MKTIKAWALVFKGDGKFLAAYTTKNEALISKRISFTPKELKIVKVEITIKD